MTKTLLTDIYIKYNYVYIKKFYVNFTLIEMFREIRFL